MRFSQAYEIEAPSLPEWFDPVLTSDTPLFVDPFLIYDLGDDEFRDAHAEVISFFDSQFQRLASTGGNQRSQVYLDVIDDLRLPEVSELCLGYTGIGTSGSGSGTDIARLIAGAMWTAIEAGLRSLTHFEEVALFRSGFGADRISDAIGNVLRHRFAEYTKRTCSQLGIPTTTYRYIRGRYDISEGRWVPLIVELPINPWTDKPLMLTPHKYLRTLPTINADDFWTYCYDQHNEELRRRFGNDIKRRVNKETAVDLARTAVSYVDEYITRAESNGSEAYDIEDDPDSMLAWHAPIYAYADAATFSAPTPESLPDLVAALVQSFKHFVEEQQGWRILIDEAGRPRPERITQRAFHLSVCLPCRKLGIDVSPEANIGRGPVDFKFSIGSVKVLLEVKHVSNTRFWRGLDAQLPIYLRAELVRNGHFLAIAFDSSEVNRVNEINAFTQRIAQRDSLKLRVTLVRAIEQPSASTA